MRKTLIALLLIVVTGALIMGTTVPVAAVDGTPDDISAEGPVDFAEEDETVDASDNITSVIVIQLNIQESQQVDVDPEDCQVAVQASEQTAEVGVEEDIDVAVVLQENVQISSQLAFVTGTDNASAEVCQEIIQINEQVADADADDDDLTVVVTQESEQLADQEIIEV